MQLAFALAQEVAEGIRTVKNEVSARKRTEFIKTKQYKELVVLNSKVKSLEKQLQSDIRRLAKEFEVELSAYDNTVSVNRHCLVYISNEELKRIKNAIVSANQLKGIPQENLVSYVTKEELLRKKTPCD